MARVQIVQDAGNYLTDDVFDVDDQVATELVVASVATVVDPGAVALNTVERPPDPGIVVSSVVSGLGGLGRRK